MFLRVNPYTTLLDLAQVVEPPVGTLQRYEFQFADQTSVIATHNSGLLLLEGVWSGSFDPLPGDRRPNAFQPGDFQVVGTDFELSALTKVGPSDYTRQDDVGLTEVTITFLAPTSGVIILIG